MKLNVINTLLKKTKRLSRKTGWRCFDTLARKLETRKKEVIFSALASLTVPSVRASLPASKTPQPRIWICWFQGIDAAPAIIQRCIASVQAHAPQASVTLINEENMFEHASLPPAIVEKYRAGKMSKAHFSDILRCELLWQHGGVWLDASIFLTRPLPEVLFSSPFCSLRFSENAQASAISQGYWTTWLLASAPGGEVVFKVKEMLIAWWLQHDDIIDYFLMDYVFKYYFEHDPAVNAALEAQPVMGNQRYLLKSSLNKPFNTTVQASLRDETTGIYKLTYKETFTHSAGGEETLYHRLINGQPLF